MDGINEWIELCIYNNMASFYLHFLNFIENIDDIFNECYETEIFNLFNSHDDVLSH